MQWLLRLALTRSYFYDEVFHEDVGMKHITMKWMRLGRNCHCYSLFRQQTGTVTGPSQAESVLPLAGITFYPHLPQIVRRSVSTAHHGDLIVSNSCLFLVVPASVSPEGRRVFEATRLLLTAGHAKVSQRSIDWYFLLPATYWRFFVQLTQCEC